MNDKSYNGDAITYDEIGNPASYYNGNYFVWDNGRQLSSVVKPNGEQAYYLYNADGIRTCKVLGSTYVYYTLEGNNVVHETDGTDELWYYYDEGGNPISFELNGTSYYYVNNLQGDIIAITDDSGSKVVEYVYDSWGKLISTTGSLASIVGAKNPYRYRGYRYDTETSLYYLQSRYYDPEIGRFINADSYVDTGDTVLGTNMFAYCENNPIKFYDPNGDMPWHLLPYKGFIHSVVQWYLSMRFGLKREVWTYSKKGRIDLYKRSTKEAWEVKPKTVSIAVAQAQLSKYKKQMYGRLKFGRKLGNFTFYFGIFKINIYANEAKGVVRYYFDLTRQARALVRIYGATFVATQIAKYYVLELERRIRSHIFKPKPYIDYDNPDTGEHFWPFY